MLSRFSHRNTTLTFLNFYSSQRRPFFYFTGCNEPDAAVVYDVKKDQLTLFIAPIDPESVIWSGLPLSPEQAKALYDVDAVQYTNEVNSTLASIASAQEGKTVAFAIDQQVSEGINFAGFAQTNLSVLKDVIGDARVVKDAYEIALLRKANDISTLGHIACMKAAGKASNEREVEAEFIKTCIAHGAREMSYHPIFAAGENGATLHYVKNDDSFFYAATTSDPSLQGQRKGSLLIDAGGEYQTYCADITRVVPLAGRFPEEARQIYEIVLEMQTQCIAMLKEGVLWDDVHALAHRVAIKGLLKLGILQGDEEEIFQKRVSVAFFPHGLGHYLGMDTHDTGGNPNYNDEDKMFRFLRTRGKLPAGSVITVEPGVSKVFSRFPSLSLSRCWGGLLPSTISQTNACADLLLPLHHRSRFGIARTRQVHQHRGTGALLARGWSAHRRQCARHQGWP